MHEGAEGCVATNPAPSGKAPLQPKRVAQIVRLTQEPPPDEATHWTARAMAKAVGIAASTVHADDLEGAWPQSAPRWRSFKLSNDPAFAEKLTKIAGLCADPGAHAVL